MDIHNFNVPYQYFLSKEKVIFKFFSWVPAGTQFGGDGYICDSGNGRRQEGNSGYLSIN